MADLGLAPQSLGLLDYPSALLAANPVTAHAETKEIAFLGSVARNDVVRALGSLLLSDIAKTEPDIAARLEEYLKLVLEISPQPDITNGKNAPINVSEELAAAQAQQARDLELEELAQRNYEHFKQDTRKRNLYSAHLARLAQIIELSGHLSRENFFDIKRRQRDSAPEKGGVPGGLERFLYRMEDEVDPSDMFTKADRKYIYRTPQEAITYLGKPILEFSLTKHPIHILRLETILLQRQMHDSAREICVNPSANLDAIKKIMHAYANNELTPIDQNGDLTIFNAEDELNLTLDTVTQIDTNLPTLYSRYEVAFNTRWGADYTKDMRWHFYLDLRINSWVMGDKDGNQKVKAEHLLLATVKHRQTALTLALQHIQKMRTQGIELDPEWETKLLIAQETLQEIKSELDTARLASGGIDLPLKQADFDRLSKASATALSEDWNDFETSYMQMLREKGKDANETQTNVLLDAYRSMRVFGLRGARIELRETSDLYTTVIATLVKNDANGKPVDYKMLSNKEQAKLLDSLITKNPNYLAEQAAAFLATADAEKLREYKGEHSAEAITYHTLKRYQEAAANPDMYTDSIIAECKGPHNMLECLAIQKMIKGISGKGLQLYIVPLFEEYSTLKDIGSILKSAFYYKAYRQHCYELAGKALSKLRQKFQIAHSDNIRRSGTTAGRGGIHAAHRDVPVQMKRFEPTLARLYSQDGIVGKSFGLILEIFQGNSLSHILRGGGRALSALGNAFKLHHHTKLTIQGADQQSYLGLATSFVRMTARFYAHSAKEIALAENTTPPSDSNPALEKAISNAFKASMPDYVSQHFGPNKNPRAAGMGHLLAHPIVSYIIYSITGNRGMRNASRGTVQKTDFIDTVNGTRAIGISENMFDADLLGTWFGAENLHKGLSAHVLRAPKIFDAFRRQVNTFFGATAVDPIDSQRLLTTQELNGLYKTSAQFRDVFDQMACGLVSSNLDRLQRRLTHYAAETGESLNEHVRAYVFETLPNSYIKAAELVLSAFGIDYDKQAMASMESKDKIMFLRHMIATHAISSYSSEYGVKMRFATAAVLARDEILTGESKGKALSQADYHALSDLFAARMLASHGRVFTGEDPHFASSLRYFVKRFVSSSLPAAKAA